MRATEWRERVLARLAERKMTRQKMAELTGLSTSYIYKLLMAGPGGRQNPSRDVLARIFGVLELPLDAAYETPPLMDYLLDRLHALPAEQQEALRQGGPAARFSWVCQRLQEDPRWRSQGKLSAALQLPSDTIQSLMAGVEPDAGLVRHLAEQTQLSVRWWIRGHLDPHPALVAKVTGLEDAQGYLESIAMAAAAGISSQALKNVVSALAAGEPKT